MAKGVPFLEEREKNHFLRVEPHEWQQALEDPRRREDRMSRSKYTRPAWLTEQGEGGQGTADKPRLTTSAMIASLAGAGQRTKPAPFGHALVALAEDAARDRRPDGRPRQVHRPAHLRAGLSRPLLPDGHGGAAADAAPPPAWRARASCPSPPPTPCSRRAAPTTSSPWRSRRRTSTSRSSAPCRGSPPATGRATRRRRTSRSSAACRT